MVELIEGKVKIIEEKMLTTSTIEEKSKAWDVIVNAFDADEKVNKRDKKNLQVLYSLKLKDESKEKCPKRVSLKVVRVTTPADILKNYLLLLCNDSLKYIPYFELECMRYFLLLQKS